MSVTQVGWKYKTGERVLYGDTVRISQRWAKEHGVNEGVVSGLYGFITVKLTNGVAVDFDARSLTFLHRKEIQ